jgi:hypothetical protein
LKSPQFYFDLVILVLHPVPYFDPTFNLDCINMLDRTRFITITYRMSHILLACMFLRLIFLVRALFNYSMYTDKYSKSLW